MIEATYMNNTLAIEIIEGKVTSEDEQEVIAAWQHLIDHNKVWDLNEDHRRTAIRLIEQGVCYLFRLGTED